MKHLYLLLNKDGCVDHGILRVPHVGYILEVHIPIGNKFHNPNVELVSNQPVGEHPDLSKETVNAIKPSAKYSIFEDVIFEIEIKTAGAYNFFLRIPTISLSNSRENLSELLNSKSEKEDKDKSKDDGYVKAPLVRYIVDPMIQINGKSLPLGSLCIQTDYGRCIGKVQNWLENLRPISELGYNMIHLPPFQELGDKSHYSLKDQLQVSKFLFDDGFPAEKRWPLLKEQLKKIEKELGIVFMADIVLNHTNPESEWLKDHPEAGYNFENSPHLKPAYYVDKVIYDLSCEIADGKVHDLPADLQVHHMGRLRQFIEDGLRKSDLVKYFTIDVDDAVRQLSQPMTSPLPKEFEMLRMRAVNYGAPQRQNILRTRGITNDKKYDIGSLKVDPNYANALYRPVAGKQDTSLVEEFRRAASTLNTPYYQHYDSVVRDVVTSVMNTFQYNRYDPNGPRLGPVTRNVPLVWRYFNEIQTTNKGMMPLANNGWIYSDNPTEDFIAEGKECYLRRQVVIWGDNVKLRYGNKPEDSPWLWEHMGKYLRSVAEIVQGIRLDNAHSTPLPVSEYFIKEARKVNPNIYIAAELFTGSEWLDIEYINHIGINSFIREGAKCIEPNKMTHLLWSAGGLPVAAVDAIDSESTVRPVQQIPGVIFDLTHDNTPPYFDPLPVTTAFSMSVSPLASNRGYDDMLDFVPSVVDEFRQYPLSKDKPAFQPFRQLLNKLRKEMAEAEMNEIMANYHGSLVTIFRCNSQTGEGVWAIVRLPGEASTYELESPAPISELVFEGRIWELHRSNNSTANKEIYPSHCNIFLNTDWNQMSSAKVYNNSHVSLCNFPENNVIIFKTKLAPQMCSFVNTLTLDHLVETFQQRLIGISITDLAVMLFRCSDEEWVAQNHSIYAFPSFGAPFYAGTKGVETAFKFAADSEAGMGSPVFTNVRDGNWLIDFILQRLLTTPRLISVEAVLRKCCEGLESLPRFLIPKYLDRVIRAINIAAKNLIVQQMSEFIQKGDDFVQSLAMSSISFFTPVSNAQLVHPHLQKFFNNLLTRVDSCTAAGFPHFSVGFMRSWGRDTMIALRGLYMCTGRFAEARDQLVAFAACMRHGLIPNLHDGGMNPRYNARDATWWFLQALQDYAYMSGEGGNVFQIKVPLLFPTDDQNEYNRRFADLDRSTRPVVTMGEIVYRIMDAHANGIHFVEWNAGSQIDSVMKQEGFKIDIVTDWTNGFILGGNSSNCGTWMDKMGSSEVASNRGIPATPRDGADVEIIGLLESTLRWLNECHENGSFAHDGIKIKAQSNKPVSWKEWSDLLCASFESWFYIPTHKEHDSMFFVEEKHVGVRGIYKDTVGSSLEFADYQFRPNLCVAMTVAPELFDPAHAVRCLNEVEERLMGKIGMRTLDPGDYRYRPYYVNSEESDCFYTAKGFNYHNGPEWVWPVGYFFRASMRFRRGVTPKMKQMLAVIKKEQLGSWACGLPELTQKDGEVCGDSCANQAWSISSILDILYDFSLYTEEDVVAWDTLAGEEEDDN
ncbi:Glycogen debranching enzyme [Tritrichomonas foetus]|uniref:Glycogen debranching enzyme n=1 Tax=Tritrichomonas foetus TaxID=1144522 RepID=A0A1J4K8G6_9EUKA|nr:Glycogen debranching enzyme [Tritrichomonas foetus]|eukprot:OHT06004.1 Glycogen debranching enzyme [Tritrichomonas foetus]